MGHLFGAFLRVHQNHDTDTKRQSGWHVHLVAADEGHELPSHLTSGHRGVLGVEVRGGGEEGGGQVLCLEVVGLYEMLQ